MLHHSSSELRVCNLVVGASPRKLCMTYLFIQIVINTLSAAAYTIFLDSAFVTLLKIKLRCLAESLGMSFAEQSVIKYWLVFQCFVELNASLISIHSDYFQIYLLKRCEYAIHYREFAEISVTTIVKAMSKSFSSVSNCICAFHNY